MTCLDCGATIPPDIDDTPLCRPCQRIAQMLVGSTQARLTQLQPTIGDLFAGYGGLALACQQAFGARVAWHSEIEPGPAKLLEAHWPGIPNHGDITRIDWTQVEPVDILAGGFPCTDVSLAGRRAGLGATRSGLWSHMLAAIEALHPRWVVIENVRGLLSTEAQRSTDATNRDMEPGTATLGDRSTGPVLRAAGAVLGDLAAVGYDARWTTLRASAIGAPHHRERVFILAYPADAGGRGFGPRTQQPGTSEPEKPTTVGGVAALPVMLPTPRAAEAKQSMTAPAAAAHVAQGYGGLSEVLGAMLPVRELSPQAALGSGPGVPAQPIQEPVNWGRYEAAIRRWEAVLGRAAPDPTEPNRNGRPRLNPEFASWMMGLPKGWVTGHGLTRTEQLKAIGNGVVPQQAMAALAILLGVR